MSETQVGFLYNIAAAISKSQNDNNTVLKSYYLMRCKDITRGYGLPDKYFSPKIRCPNCCIEWKSNTDIKIRSIKLSKRQKQRLKSKKIIHNKKESVRNRNKLLNSNELEQLCMFCKNSTVTPILKPEKQLLVPTKINNVNVAAPKHNLKDKNLKLDYKNMKSGTKEKPESNVYSNALDIFSMQNKNNTLASTIKEKKKVINNNKKKKDKFAGLCQKAVLASAKLKEQKKKTENNSLNLFLKPSIT